MRTSVTSITVQTLLKSLSNSLGFLHFLQIAFSPSPSRPPSSSFRHFSSFSGDLCQSGFSSFSPSCLTLAQKEGHIRARLTEPDRLVSLLSHFAILRKTTFLQVDFGSIFFQFVFKSRQISRQIQISFYLKFPQINVGNFSLISQSNNFIRIYQNSNSDKFQQKIKLIRIHQDFKISPTIQVHLEHARLVRIVQNFQVWRNLHLTLKSGLIFSQRINPQFKFFTNILSSYFSKSVILFAVSQSEHYCPIEVSTARLVPVRGLFSPPSLKESQECFIEYSQKPNNAPAKTPQVNLDGPPPDPSEKVLPLKPRFFRKNKPFPEFSYIFFLLLQFNLLVQANHRNFRCILLMPGPHHPALSTAYHNFGKDTDATDPFQENSRLDQPRIVVSGITGRISVQIPGALVPALFCTSKGLIKLSVLQYQLNSSFKFSSSCFQ
eukprot:TRINITY_DN3742_c0_g1_i1.p1 TRINITY_DN3742_c0_g1~~TRINITY_DN3742_c0_g1_i1.p1  ORF type:complete len:462 (-),score=-45.50 TRINITY_DN3742_c0_g1_i1:1284-2588(-)